MNTRIDASINKINSIWNDIKTSDIGRLKEVWVDENSEIFQQKFNESEKYVKAITDKLEMVKMNVQKYENSNIGGPYAG